jgi:hypothetical protein
MYALILILVVKGALLAALAAIALLFYRRRMKTNKNAPDVTEELTQEQADEITSTWNSLNH